MLVEVLAVFVAHGLVGHAENGLAQVEVERPAQEVDEVVGDPIAFVQLPHGDVGEAHEDAANEDVLPASAVFGPRVVGDEPHDGVGDGVENARQELDDAPQHGGEAEVLDQNNDEHTQGGGKHLVGQHAEAEGDFLPHGDGGGRR